MSDRLRSEPLDSSTSQVEPTHHQSGARVSEAERLRRWRLLLGSEAEEGLGVSLNGDDRAIDRALAAVYDLDDRGASGGPGQRRSRSGSRSGGLGRSAPTVARWLGDIRTYFDREVVQVLQRDAIERFDLRQLLLEPELLDSVQPDIHLATTLVELNQLLPDQTRATARQVIAGVLDEVERRLADRTKQAVRGALARSARTRRPRPGDIDLARTVQRNLKHYQPAQRALIAEQLVGFGRRQRSLGKHVIIAVDQSGSMADSVVYASLFAGVLGQIPALRTSLVVFDTEVADMSDLLSDPVDVLFGVQLGGGTDIARAMSYVAQLVERPRDTLVVLISDLYEGGDPQALTARVASMIRSGVAVLVLLALSDDGTPSHDARLAAELSELGATVMSSTPDAFPDVLATQLQLLS